jgi:hypothetical protein
MAFVRLAAIWQDEFLRYLWNSSIHNDDNGWWLMTTDDNCTRYYRVTIERNRGAGMRRRRYGLRHGWKPPPKDSENPVYLKLSVVAHQSLRLESNAVSS